MGLIPVKPVQKFQQPQTTGRLKPVMPKRAPIQTVSKPDIRQSIQRPDIRQSDNYKNAIVNSQRYAQEAQKASSFRGMAGNFLKAVPRATADVLVGTPFKMGASLAEIPRIVATGGQTSQREYKIPGLSPFKSYQSDFKNVADDVIEGKKGLGSAALSFANPVLGGLEMLGIGKGISKGVKAFRGAPTLSQGIRKATPEIIDAFLPTTRGFKKGATETKLRNDLADLQTQRMRASLAVERSQPQGYRSGLKFEVKEIPIKQPKKNPLIQEAKKYKSAEEFTNAQFSKKPEYGMSHRPSWEGMPPAHNLLDGETLPRDAYTHPDFSLGGGRIRSGDKAANESWDVLQKIKDKPDAEITVYRAGAKNKLNTGDWVTFSKDYANQSLEGTEKVYSFKVKAKDVLFAGDDINEFGYYPKSKYEEIYNQARQSQPIQEGVGLKVKGQITTPKINYKKFIEENFGIRDKKPDTRRFNKPISEVEQKLKDPSLFVQDMRTGTAKNFSTPRKIITSGERILEESGEGGKELARRIRTQQQNYQLVRGHDEKFIDDIFRGFSKKESLEVSDILEGAKPTSLKTGTAAKILRNWLNKRQNKAVEAGLDVGYLENYYPRKYDFDELTKSGRKEKILQEMVDKGQSGTKAEAEKTLQDFIFKNSERKYGNLEYERMYDIPGYERDPRKALKQYADSVAGRLSEVQTFGKKDEIANALINKISEGGGDYREAQRIFDFMYKGEPQNKLVNNLTKFQALTKLSLAFFSNATQSVNTASIGGIGRTVKAIVKNFTDFKNSDDFAKIAGVYQDMNIKQELGFEPGKLMNLVMKPFNIVERFNRRVAATTGKLKGIDLINDFKKNPQDKYIIESLEKLGIKTEKLLAGKINDEDLIKAANTFTYKTQFLANAFNIPPAWRTPTGKLLSQFKSFSFMQTKFVRDEILKEARKGNIAPLVKFLFMAPVASFTAQSLRNKVNLVSPEKEAKQGTTRPWDKYLKAYGTIPTDLATQVEYSIGESVKPYTTQIKNIKNFASPFVGPTIGELGEIANAAESSYQTKKTNQQWYSKHPAAQQDSSLPWKRYGASHIPFIGRSLMNTVFDYKPTTAKNAKAMAAEALTTGDKQLLKQAIEKDPYLYNERVIQGITGKKIKEMSEKERKLYEEIKNMKKSGQPFY
jgi:hypothetical protein